MHEIQKVFKAGLELMRYKGFTYSEPFSSSISICEGTYNRFTRKKGCIFECKVRLSEIYRDL